jgi:hypothetical protein
MLGSTFAGKVTTWYRPSGFECELIAPLFPKDPTEPTRGSSPPDAPIRKWTPYSRFKKGR